jgi:hypothetical protein
MDQAAMYQQSQPQPATPPAQPAAQPAATQPAPTTPQEATPQQQATPQQPAPAKPRFDSQQVTPVVQIAPPRPADEVGVPDVLIGSIALIAVLVAAALVVGLVTGGIFIAIRRWRDKNDPDSTEPEATRLKLS